jgi:hypothetical protein
MGAPNCRGPLSEYATVNIRRPGLFQYQMNSQASFNLIQQLTSFIFHSAQSLMETLRSI